MLEMEFRVNSLTNFIRVYEYYYYWGKGKRRVIFSYTPWKVLKLKHSCGFASISMSLRKNKVFPPFLSTYICIYKDILQLWKWLHHSLSITLLLFFFFFEKLNSFLFLYNFIHYFHFMFQFKCLETKLWFIYFSFTSHWWCVYIVI